MLQITAAQKTLLAQRSFERYIDRLTTMLRSESFSKDLASHIAEPDSEADVRSLANKLVARAYSLGIKSEGDVTPFCLLAVCMDDEFRRSGIYAWVGYIVQATDFTGEERMDAIYSLLPDSVRVKVFQY